MATRRIEPGYANPIAFLDHSHSGADSGNQADALMSGYERQRRFDGPVSVRGMKIGVANPARFGLDQDLTGCR